MSEINLKQIEEDIKEVLSKRLDIKKDKICLDSKLGDDLGMDSFDAIEVMFEIEDKFDIEVPEKDLLDVKTVRDMLNYIIKRLKNLKIEGE